MEWDANAGLTIDLEACAPASYFTWLGLGSAWAVVHPDGDHCEVWLGGETEDPMYGGGPTQYCRFVRDGCEASVGLSYENLGGPAVIDERRV